MTRSLTTCILLTLAAALTAVGCLDAPTLSSSGVTLGQDGDQAAGPGAVASIPGLGDGKLTAGGGGTVPVTCAPSEAGLPDDPACEEVTFSDPVDLLDPEQLIAHEWGTFVSMVTPEGQILEGMHHEEEPLPNFVYSRCGEVPWCWGYNAIKEMEILPEPVTQKLETPVIYFYSAEPREVTIDVTFPQGIISQWYPDAVAMQPLVNFDLQAMAGGGMTWTIEVDPEIDIDQAPWVPEDHIWAPSRDVAATPISAKGETEAFIFYRGLGRFTTPLEVHNDGTTVSLGFKAGPTIPSVWLLHVRDGKAAITHVGAIAAGPNTNALIPEPNMDMVTFLPHAKALVAQGLEADGLFSDEAKAMVNTWERSYFQTEGFRVLYVLPRSWTDELLPISFDPVPDELVRTMVGRIEVLTPWDVDEMVGRVAGWAAAPGTAAELVEMPRFAEPRLRAACKALETADSPLADYCDTLIGTIYETNL